ADFHSINPGTARKGRNLLVDVGVLDKRRGIGMFVASGATDNIRERRRREFAADYVAPLVDEAVRLNYSRAALTDLIERIAESRGLYKRQRQGTTTNGTSSWTQSLPPRISRCSPA